MSRYILGIFGQRRCNYEGQYAVEYLDGIDGFSDGENPDWLQERLLYFQNTKEFSKVKVVKLHFSQNKLSELFKDGEMIITLEEQNDSSK